ncbi:hypothetical protein BH23GEM4_BH23GEM4_15840 [soil metagenome]
MNELLAPDSRICVVLLTGVGDVVHGLPVVNAIKAHAPACHLTWVVEPTPSAVLRHHPAVDEIVVYEKARSVSGVLDLRRRLRKQRFDVTLNFNVYFKSVWPTLFSASAGLSESPRSASSATPIRGGWDRTGGAAT